MDPYVHGLVAGAITPYDKEVRSVNPFLPNGSDPSSHEGVKSIESAFAQNKHHKHHKHHKEDINARGMIKGVHGFASGATYKFEGFEKPETPYDLNGSDPSAHIGAANDKMESLAQGDINSRGMEGRVHGFANGSLPPSPFDNEVRPAEYGTGFVPNGSDPSAHDGVAFSQLNKDHSKEDIVASRGMANYVYGFSSGAVSGLENEERSKVAPAPNGSNPSSHG